MQIDAMDPEKNQTSIRKECRLFLFALGSGASFLAIGGLLGRLDVNLEILSHFYMQYLLALLAVLVGYFGLRQWKFVGLFLLPFLICTFKVAPLYFSPKENVPAAAPHLRLVQLNVNTANRNYDAVANYIRSTDADIAAFEETDQRWIIELEKRLLDKYPYALTAARPDNFGIATFSKLPFSKSQVTSLGGVDLPCIQLKMTLAGKPFTFVDLHTLPPMDSELFAARNKQMYGLVQRRRELGERYILSGDFNCSSWSPFFEDLMQGLQLKDSCRGFGVQCSWPTMTVLLGTTLDHFLTSEHFVTIEHKIGPSVGSDHFPVFAEVAVVR